MSADENNLIWIDLEMTGLDPERDRIIEIATLVTDASLNILAEGADDCGTSIRCATGVNG
ncbi:Oligoribonuclease [Salmonella enterica subsp. enterica]|uniref:Oligoribonuclease n=1 Tax=Salmonella enterica I TaxID=59201 RepID=A0A3S4LNT5_SALET|nr:Oligoribonuclease [Salmonella enterica subsp. enterica]